MADLRVEGVVAEGLEEASRLSAARRSARPSSRLRRHAVLIVDRDVRLRTLLVRALEDRGHEVAAAADGQSAVRLLARGPWCVVLEDGGDPDAPAGDPVSSALVASLGATALVRLTGNPAWASSERSRGGRLLKPLFVLEWLELIDAHCRIHEGSRDRPADRERELA